MTNIAQKPRVFKPIRKLIRRIYRYTHPQTMYHNDDDWGFISLKYNNHKEITQLRYKQKNYTVIVPQHTHHYYANDLYIMATGPSIKEIDTNSLKNKTLMGVNGAFHLDTQLHFQFYVIIDRGFMWKNIHAIYQLLENGTHLFTTPTCLHSLLKQFDLKEEYKITLFEQLEARVFKHNYLNEQELAVLQQSTGILIHQTKPLIGFSENLSLGLFDARTVSFSALQIAVHLGFNDIHFLGLDLGNNQATSNTRFYNEQKVEPSYITDDFLPFIEPHFKVAQAYCLQNKISLTNHSMQSKLSNEIISKQPFPQININD